MTRLTVIVATYNRAESLVRTLRSLIDQTAPRSTWEVVVVDNRSTDNTPERVASFLGEHPELPARMVREERQGLSYARNRGIAESRGEILAIIDDDEEVNPGFVGAYLDFFDTHPDVLSAGGAIVPVYEAGRPVWMSRWTEVPIANPILLGPVACPFRGRRYPGGGNMALRRTVVERYGAFDPALGRKGNQLTGGEETDLFARLARAGERPWYVPQAIVRHHIQAVKATPDYLMRVARMVGVTARIRSKSDGRYLRRLAGEGLRWGASLCYATGFLLTGRSEKGVVLLQMRKEITLGLLEKKS